MIGHYNHHSTFEVCSSVKTPKDRAEDELLKIASGMNFWLTSDLEELLGNSLT